MNEVLTDRRIRRGSFEAASEDARKRYNSEGEDLKVLPEVPPTVSTLQNADSLIDKRA